MAQALGTVIPRHAHLLDIGGGDGEPLNHLLAVRADIRVVTLDPGPVVGQWIEPRFAARVERLPGTTLEAYLAQQRPSPDAVLLADVMHHIPAAARPAFLRQLRVLLDRAPALRLIVKDVEPGHWRASLGYCSDRYVTGDRGVSLVSRQHLVGLLAETLGPLRREETDLFRLDPPNYAIAFYR